MAVLFENQSSDGNSDPVNSVGADFTVSISGNFDGATVQIQSKSPSGGWITPQQNGTFTAPDKIEASMRNGEQIRAVLSSAGSTTSVTVEVL